VSRLVARLQRLPRPHIGRPHLALPHVARPHLARPHLARPRFALPHVALPHIPRPRVRVPHVAWRRLALRIVRVVIVVVVMSVALGGAAFAAVTFYGSYGAVRNAPNAEAWRGLTPGVAGAASCTSCHTAEAGAQDASIHADVSCEDCHGAGAAHASSDAAARVTVLAKPTAVICITCHQVTAGRPAGFPQVDLSAHYAGGLCLRCHDPHSVVAVRPPVVTHPLTNLPVCTTCHAPDGLKKVPSGHEAVADTVCLSCHGPAAIREP
jgi:hypothetical protein